MSISKGAKAPEFTLKHKHANGLDDVSLSAALKNGKVVLLFFPLAFTSVCQSELCSVSGGLDAYQGATVFGISVDSPFAQEAFAKSAGISIKLLSDFNKDVASAYGVLYAELLGFKGVAKRSAFVINQDGTVAYSWVTEDPHNLPPFEEVQAAVKA